MSRLFLFLLLFSTLALTAQSEEGKSATQLHDAAKVLLQKDSIIRAFDKLQALGNFQESQQVLAKQTTPNLDLQTKNTGQIQALRAYFLANTNADSLLALTRFFPDSVFQANPRYNNSFKNLIGDYLNLKQSSTRAAFFKIKALNYRHPSESTPNQLIDFNHYWPFEVQALEAWVKNQENKARAFPKKAKNALLELAVQNKLVTLRNAENTKYAARNKKSLLGKLEKATKDIETAEANYTQLKYIGLGILGLVLLLGYYFRKKGDQLLKSKNQSLLEEKKRSEDLLTNMLPAEVVRQLKTKGAAKARKYDAVSVLFSDFKGFSTIAETLSPEELVSELNHCFTVFDRITEKYRLQKIKTIGDAYMCVGGLYTRGGNHVQRMVFAALEIQQFLADRQQKRTAKNLYSFEARIGIHTGPIVAGVIGRKKIAFDVWGNTVNVAQQMEHHGEVGKVNISGETFALVKKRFVCLNRGKVTAKNKQDYEMYFVGRVIKK
ncbi:MAG: adenylate/guanylate cyclase domain-containing protein [Saprospiraceae bacterium]